MLEEHRVAAARGVEEAEAEHVLDGDEQQHHAEHRRGQHLDDAGARRCAQTNSGSSPGEARRAHACAW